MIDNNIDFDAARLTAEQLRDEGSKGKRLRLRNFGIAYLALDAKCEQATRKLLEYKEGVASAAQYRHELQDEIERQAMRIAELETEIKHIIIDCNTALFGDTCNHKTANWIRGIRKRLDALLKGDTNEPT